MNFFSATNDLFEALDVVDRVAVNQLTPAAFAPANLPATNAVCCACVVLISGYFESFLKEITQELITGLNTLNKPLASIPYKMRAKHYRSGAKALEWEIRQEKKTLSTARSEDLARRIGSFHHANHELAWEAFADTRSNPGPLAVEQILGGLEISKSWGEINSLVTEHGQLNTFLESFIEIRNICAHTGSYSSPPTGVDIQDYTVKFRAIAECIDFLMKYQYESVYSHW